MASIEVYNLNPVDYAGAGFVGEPGHREFYIQGTKDGTTASVLLEKQQLDHISSEAINFLNMLSKDFSEEEVATPSDFDNAGLVLPIDSLFRVRSISLIFDEHTLLLTLIFRESDIDTTVEFDESSIGNSNYSVIEDSLVQDKVLRLTMTRKQLRALAVKGHLAIGKGREICQLCFLPKDIGIHICPRMN